MLRNLNPDYYLELKDITADRTPRKDGQPKVLIGKLNKGNKDIAIKLRNGYYENLLHEASVMSIFQSAPFVRLLGFIPSYAETMIVMDLYEADLTHLIAREFQNLQLLEKFSWLSTICLGIQEMHQKGYVHRDLKPCNIFVTKSRRVKIGDLGLAFLLSDIEKTPDYHAPVGSLRYMAPERRRWAGDAPEKLTTALDIYSLGGIMFHLATGKEPHAEVKSGAQITLNIDENNLDPVPDSCHPIFKECISACWNSDPAKRPSAEYLAKRFKRAAMQVEGQLLFESLSQRTLFFQKKRAEDKKPESSNSKMQVLKLKEVWDLVSVNWRNLNEISPEKSLLSCAVMDVILAKKVRGVVDEELLEKIAECDSIIKSIKDKTPEEAACIHPLLAELTGFQKAVSITMSLEAEDKKPESSNSKTQMLELQEAWNAVSVAWKHLDKIFSEKSLFFYAAWKLKVMAVILEKGDRGVVDEELLERIDKCDSMIKSIKAKTPEEAACIHSFLAALTSYKKAAVMAMLLKNDGRHFYKKGAGGG